MPFNFNIIHRGAIKPSGLKMLFAFACVVFFCVFQVASIVMLYPWHASCQIQWEIPSTSCNDVRSQLISQMNTWEGDSNCGQTSDSCPSMPCGQNCLYKYTETEQDGTLKGYHETPVKRYKDYLSFKFDDETEANVCKVEAFSTSGVWYAYLDFGTNYCNLRNLLDGAGLSSGSGFREQTDDSVCTQYTSRDCSRY